MLEKAQKQIVEQNKEKTQLLTDIQTLKEQQTDISKHLQKSKKKSLKNKRSSKNIRNCGYFIKLFK